MPWLANEKVLGLQGGALQEAKSRRISKKIIKNLSNI